MRWVSPDVRKSCIVNLVKEPDTKDQLPKLAPPKPRPADWKKPKEAAVLPARLDLREAGKRVMARERLICPMTWPED